jgi:hypothetical protein
LLGGLPLPLGLLTVTPAAWSPVDPAGVVVCGLFWALVLIGELAERYLFFAAVVANRMPGGLST